MNSRLAENVHSKVSSGGIRSIPESYHHSFFWILPHHINPWSWRWRPSINRRKTITMKRNLEDRTDSNDKPDGNDSHDEIAVQIQWDEGGEAENATGDDDDNDEQGDFPPPVQCWDNAVNVSDSLIRDAKILWDCYGGDKAKAKSFWVDADDEPTCCIEATALQMADFHLQGIEYAGVEIWTQLRTSKNPGLGFHFDKDEQAAANENIWKHPVVGTATYLSAGGGAPLVVFATASPEGNIEAHGKGEESQETDDKNRKKPAERSNAKKQRPNDQSTAGTEGGSTSSMDHGPSHAWVCYPVKGRHVAFAGNLLHGVPQELLLGTQQEDRLSLLVNIWLDHKPASVEKLGEKIVHKLNSSNEGAFVLEDSETGRQNEPLQPLELEAKEPLLTLLEHVPGDTASLPAKAIQAEADRNTVAPFIQISYPTVS